jgi:thiol-disulfide isomerase/thioredoxin
MRLGERVNDAAAAWASRDPNKQDVEDVDEPIGKFELVRLDGKPFDIASLKGKIVIIDFWATWCMSCRPSLESSDRLQREFPGDIVVVAPAGDPLESQNKAAQFLASKEYRFIHVIDDPEKRSLTTPWIPARVAVDRAGRIRVKETGATGIGIAQFEKRVRELLMR